MTDGYVGNEMQIISEVQRHPNARVFAFGIGNSVNRFLLDKMSETGRGEVEYVALTDDGSAAAKRFHERVRNPLLTDISVDWSQLPVADIYPQRIPDLFGAKPVILKGRYTAAGRGVIRLKGKMGGQEFVREIAVEFPESESRHDVLSSLWARSRIDDLMSQDYNGAQRGAMKPELKETITNLGLEYRLMSQFTSFVAVEEMIVTEGGQPRRVDVPVEVPEGINRATAFGEAGNAPILRNVSGFFYLAPGATSNSGGAGLSADRNVNFSVSETVTVSGSDNSIDTSSTSVTTVLGERLIDPAAANNPPRASKPKSRRAQGKSSGAGSGGGLGEQGSANENSSQELKRRHLETTLHPSLLAVVNRLEKNDTKAGADETKFIREGKAEIQIWLTDKSPATLAKLKELGFEVVLDPKSANLLIGRLPIEKLATLAELKFVRYVAPQVSRD